MEVDWRNVKNEVTALKVRGKKKKDSQLLIHYTYNFDEDKGQWWPESD